MAQVYTKMLLKTTALVAVLGLSAGAVLAQSAPGSSAAITRSMDGHSGLNGADSMGKSTTEGSSMKDTMDTKTDAGAVGNSAPEPTSDNSRAADAMTNDATMNSTSAPATGDKTHKKTMHKTSSTKKTSMKTSAKDDSSAPLMAWVRPAGSDMNAKPQMVSLNSSSEQPSIAYPVTTYGTNTAATTTTSNANSGTAGNANSYSYSTNTQGATTTAPGYSASTRTTTTRLNTTGTNTNAVSPAAGQSDTMGSTTNTMRGATQDNDIMKR